MSVASSRQAVVVTGASNGIGRCTAETLAARGFQVLNLDRSGRDELDESIRTLEVNLTDREGLETLLGQLAREYEIVGLVNNAALAEVRPLTETNDALLTATFDLNLRCAAQCARVLVPAMRERGFGRIVNVASRSALGRQHRTAYAASKGGLIAMTRVWALEFAAEGITANCVAPGPIATTFFDELNPPGSAAREKMVSDIPLRRMGSPADVANAICFFLAAESGYLTGQTLYVCGGLSVGVAPL